MTGPGPEIVRVSERAFLVRFRGDDEEEESRRILALLARLETAPPTGFVFARPASSSLLVEGDDRLDGKSLALLARQSGLARIGQAGSHLLDVVPGGEDLRRVLDATGLSEAEFWTTLADASLFVAFVGFAPGFAYLAGVPPALRVPRLPSPRPRVPAGSLALGGPYAGIYPSSTAGGWNLVGRCDVRLFDPSSERAALLAAGDAVRLRVKR